MPDQRLPIFPTRMNLKLTETKQKSAEKGHLLLKRKSDALKARHKAIMAKFRASEEEITQKLRDAFFKLTEAEFLGANLRMFVHESQKQKITIKTEVDQISGVVLPVFTLQKDNIQPILFLDKSGQVLNDTRMMFIDVLERLVQLCALKNSLRILDAVLVATNRRVNALEFSLIPRLENTISYINSELDEQDREDFFRLKKIQKLKNKSSQ
jgi:V-type H+-transporting ATPase subunit D